METSRKRLKAFHTLDEKLVSSSGTKELIKRLKNGREQFGSIARININAALQLSSLNLELGDKSDKIIRFGGGIAQTSNNIRQELSKTMGSTSIVMDEHENMSNTLADVANNSNAVLGSLEQNKEALMSMENTCAETVEASRIMQTDMSELQKKIAEVKSAVASINSISNQINLLSLNASVEAARAGAAGKGFGVVAGEIHKLYENTNEMIKDMDKSLHNITIASDRSVKSVGTTVKSLEHIRENVSFVVERNEESGGKIESVVADISKVAATSEEISSSINEISQNMGHLGIEADELLNMTKNLEILNNDLMVKIIKPIRLLEDKLDESTGIIGQMNNDRFYMLENKVFADSMEGAVKAHRTWVSTLKLVVESRELVPLQSNPRKCGFGHFYYAISPKKKDIVAIWEGVEKPHNELHRLGEEAEMLIKRGEFLSLEAVYQRAVQLSETLITKFTEMIRLCQEYDNAGKSVFEED